LDREYLEDYEQREFTKIDELERRILEGNFDFEYDSFPPNDRFKKIKKPIAVVGTLDDINDLWALIPFSGSLVLPLPAREKTYFEQTLFQISELPKVIDFIKETGRLQIALADPPTAYIGLNHFDPLFKELNPPCYEIMPLSCFGNENEIDEAYIHFSTLAEICYFDYIRDLSRRVDSRFFDNTIRKNEGTYTVLKLAGYQIAEEIENLMIDNPGRSALTLHICRALIVEPLCDLRSSIRDYSLREIRLFHSLPQIYHPKELRFPCEIGKFLLRKLTYAAQDMRACHNLMDDYATYDLQKIQEFLNEGIVTNHPDIVNESAEEFSEILDNVWNDATIPRRIKNLRRGIPMSIAAIGTAVSAFTGDLEGFLAGLGLSVGAKFLDAEIEGLSERIAKWLTRSYQANVYDFKKKYKHRIVSK